MYKTETNHKWIMEVNTR